MMVGVVILNYNNTKDIEACVDSLFTFSNVSQIKLMLVDNGSNEKCYEHVKKFLKRKFNTITELFDGNESVNLTTINYLRLHQNVGYARGNNAGLELFYQDDKVSHIMILNSDVLLTEDIITPLYEKAMSIKKLGAISPLLLTPNGNIDYCCARENYTIQDLTFTFSYLFNKTYIERTKGKKILLKKPELLNTEKFQIELPSGSCMMFNKRVLEQIGGFDPNTFLYYEESILFEKLKRLGLESYLIPSVSCIHLGGATTNKTQTSYFLKKCNYDSLLYYIQTYLDFPCVNLWYIKITGKLRLLRLRLGEIYRVLAHDV